MKYLKENELLKKLSLIPLKEWSVDRIGACSTVVNNAKIEIMGDSDWGADFYIKINEKTVYESDHPNWPPFGRYTDTTLNTLCRKVYSYHFSIQKNKSDKIIEKILA